MKTIRWGMIGCGNVTEVKSGPGFQLAENFDLHNPLHIQQPLIQTIVNQLLGIGNCPSTGETAIRTNWVLDQLLS